MKAKIDNDKREQEITFLQVDQLVHDVILGVQRGVDVYVSFLTEEKGGYLKNSRCVHFSAVSTSKWTEEKALTEVMKHIEAGNILKQSAVYQNPLDKEI